MEKNPTNLQTFALRFNSHILFGDTYEEGCNTLVLHGAGNSSRTRFTRMRESLCVAGIFSASFDFIGHGETGGEMNDTTLRGRTEQAAAVIHHTCTEPLTLIAASMGAYTAIKLAELFSVENMILLVPAVYTPHAYHLPFGPEFSAAIRVPESWAASDAFRILGKFTGNLLVIAAENDHVIPRGVIERIQASAKQAVTNHVHTVPGSGHLSLFTSLQNFQETMNMICALCSRTNRDKGL